MAGLPSAARQSSARPAEFARPTTVPGPGTAGPGVEFGGGEVDDFTFELGLPWRGSVRSHARGHEYRPPAAGSAGDVDPDPLCCGVEGVTSQEAG
jgi:hypothetical protein